MKHSNCTTCGKEKTDGRRPLCNSCCMIGKKYGPPSEETRRKISEAHKGKTLSEEHRRKISISEGGDGRVGEKKFDKYPGKHKWAAAVKERDGCCFICQTTEKLEAHHILPKAQYREYYLELWNGVTLCKTHHIQKHRDYE